MRTNFLREIAAAIALTVIAAAQASAQGNPFVIDGVVPANGNPGGVAPTEVTDPYGSVQELGALNSNTTKVGVVHADTPPTLDFTNPNGQVDLRRIWIQSAKSLTNNDLWLYFAWERDKETGSGFISFEFQQNQLSAACAYSGTGIDLILPKTAEEQALINSCNPWANRKPGDFLILWDQQGSGLDIKKRVFEQPGGPGTPLVLGGLQPLGSAVVDISATGFFGEAAINLTTDVFPSGGTCVNFANIIPGTVTGNSDTADYKDTVLSAFPDISNCGTVTVTKITEPVASPPNSQSFAYRLDRTGGGQIKFDGSTSLDDSVAHGETDTHLLLAAGPDYRLHETVVAGYDLVKIECVQGGTTYKTPNPNDVVFPVVASETTSCTITNRKRQGMLRVIKRVVNDNGGTATASQFLMSINDGSTPEFNGVAGSFGAPATGGMVFTLDEGRTFNVSENMGSLAGQYTASVQGTCAGQIEANVEKVCQITNDDIPATLIVIKHVVNDNGGTRTAAAFTMTVTGSDVSAPSFPGAESPGTTVTLDAGSYSVSEIELAGYLKSVSGNCSGSIANGETKTCTITNDDLPPSLTLVKVVVNDNGGTAPTGAFILIADGPTSFSGVGPSVSSGQGFDAGTYALSETGPAPGFVGSYVASAWVCSGGTQNGANITVGLGEAVTCTITNDDLPATPSGATVMRQVLHDTLNIIDIRPGSGALLVTFRLYSDVACQTEIGTAEERQLNADLPVTVDGSIGSATTVKGVLVDTDGQYRWRAFFSGNQFNGPFETACGSEISEIKFTPSQPPQ